MILKKKSLLALGFASLMFVACGDESSSDLTSSNPSDDKGDSSTSWVEAVESIYDLGKCDSKRDGHVVFVEDDDVYYVCENSKWHETEEPSSSSQKVESSSSFQKVESSSSVNGGSKDESSNSKSEGSSSSKGGNSNPKDDSGGKTESSSSGKSSSSVAESSSSVPRDNEEIENIAISKKVFTGVVEKGPYASGTAVKVSELDDELDATGTSFEWEVINDKGAYTSAKVSLKSRYALLQASGFYLNEVTNKSSDSQLALRALVDLGEKDGANINVLTHLAVRRTINLFTQSGQYKNVIAAKAKAEQEVMEAFFMPKVNHSFEDLTVFGSGEDDAKLLAVSLLVLANNTDADVSKLIANVANGLEADGKWDEGDDENYKAVIIGMADWAYSADLAKIRENLEKIGDVPDFEKYVYHFMAKAYGMSSCLEKSDGYIERNTAPSSKFLGDTLTCDGSIYRKIHASEISMQYACTKSREGEIRAKPYTTTDYICHSGNWTLAGVYDYPKSHYFNADYKYGTLKDDRDGKEYKTTTIGNQTWMAENLNFYDRSNPDLAELYTYCYERKDENCDVAGRLYTWAAALNIDTKYHTSSVADAGVVDKKHRGACPDGWHIPTLAEWGVLADYVKEMSTATSPAYALQVLKSAYGWNTTSSDAVTGGSTDEYGFSVIPAGAYYGVYASSSVAAFSTHTFDDVSYFANFWTADEGDLKPATTASYVAFDFRSRNMILETDSYNEKKRGFSVRCVKD
ncbi:major paralogous domain-containing protein [Fibrobacter sp. UWT2]|uniref:fibrobacter succinogenes major paralogous domain-containing protein n=1 Tax=Fibrobacter sp. UWT2 TaxID=1896224 RepID=UPI0009113E41|nr:fibrobacter succinogenes major paralogous domain-containing protein [Fibrobacter sp. UWT2]SHK32053.1 major paralogous domain-containing protein [Fibrobacter sp. UWT2]